MKKLSKNVLLVLCLLLALPIAAAAQQQESLSGGSGFRVADPTKELVIDAGTADTERISIRNITNDEQTARAIVEDFGAPDDESGAPRILLDSEAEDNPYSIQPFVQEIQDVTLASGEEAEVTVTLVVPEETSPGSYFGVVRFVNATDFDAGEGEGSAVNLNASVGVIFLVTVPGETVDSLTLEQVSAARGDQLRGVFGSAPDSLQVRIRNDGNTFQAPFGTITVKDWSGETVQEFNINDARPPQNVLPDSVRRFEEPLENIGSFGRYQVEGFISYGTGGNIIQLNTTFWVVPWVTIFVVSGVVVGAAFFATRGLKAYNRSVVRRAKGKSSKNMR